MHCNHPNKIEYKELTEPCKYCGRINKNKVKGCGACIGRGGYTYPACGYDICYCGGWELKKYIVIKMKNEK